MAGNDFLLPDDLGWDCNDEISKRIDKWSDELLKSARSLRGTDPSYTRGLWEVSKAELSDDIYAIIKKYQKKYAKIQS